jgi:hypothetical protein
MTEGLKRVERAAGAAAKRGLPPVHLWNPAHVGDIDIVIRLNGEWLHEGAVIGRPALVRLFSTVLRRDPDGICLVTPVEKLRIVVEDAPFVAVAVERRGEALTFTTNVGDEVTAGAEHPIRVVTDPTTGEPRPYIHVRAGLDALIARPVFYELVEMAEDVNGRLTIASNGQTFQLGETELSR